MFPVPLKTKKAAAGVTAAAFFVSLPETVYSPGGDHLKPRHHPAMFCILHVNRFLFMGFSFKEKNTGCQYKCFYS